MILEKVALELAALFREMESQKNERHRMHINKVVVGVFQDLLISFQRRLRIMFSNLGPIGIDLVGFILHRRSDKRQVAENAGKAIPLLRLSELPGKFCDFALGQFARREIIGEPYMDVVLPLFAAKIAIPYGLPKIIVEKRQ